MPLDDGQVLAFEAYAETLYRLNAVMNLTRVSRDECEVRHFIDSLLVAEFVPPDSKVLDIGTGPGLPAWPLARARPDTKVTAIDSSAKMLQVLEACPLPNLRFKQARAEELGSQETYDIVTGRALAPLAVQLEVSAAWCKVGGAVVPFRTLDEDYDIDAGLLGLVLEGVNERALPGTGTVRAFPVYRKTGKTPKNYPRPWAQIKRRPIGPSL